MNQFFQESFRRFEDYLAQTGFKGWDCYDALRSPILRTLTKPNKWLRMAAIQAMKRSPFNFRRLWMVRKGYNPKGLGLFLSANSRLYRTHGDQKYLKNIDFLDKLLLQVHSAGYSGMAWGYNFDWQSKVFFVPEGTPTIVNSSFIGHAYLDAFEATGNPVFLKNARSICDFFLNDLHRTVEGDTICFSYTPIDNLKVHNANILGAGLLARVYSYSGEGLLRDTALQAANYVVKYQREDGAWFYAETKIQDWVDSFHTGFVLENLDRVAQYTQTNQYESAILAGYRYYLDHFFLPDGTPKYYDKHVWPADIHSAAQAIVTMVRLTAKDKRSREILELVVNWSLTQMQSQKGYFYFQKHRHYTIRIPYIRWSQAWMYHALTAYYQFHVGFVLA